MHIRILGSGAGGGFPQWNCNCHNCDGLRQGRLRARARTQSSIAVSDDGRDWVLINASPDIRQQLLENPDFQPARGARDTGIRAVLLMDAQIDHTTGLLSLREGEPIELYSTAEVREELSSGFPLIPMLAHYCGVNCHDIHANGGSFGISAAPGLEFTAVPLTSKAPPYSPHRDDSRPGDNIGLVVRDRDNGRRLFYAPGLGRMDEPVREAMSGADCVLVEGTFWQEDDMRRMGVGHKLAADMGHLPLAGDGGLLEHLRGIRAGRKLLIHINNTNPILDEDSAERHLLAREGVEVAHDGMDIFL